MLNRRHLCLGVLAAGVAAPARAQNQSPTIPQGRVLSQPGVYIEEIPSGVHAIAPVATGRFLIVDRFGVAGLNTFTSMAQFDAATGAADASPEARAQLTQFFANGGSHALTLDVDPANAGAILGASGGDGLRGLLGGPALDIDFIAVPCAARSKIRTAAKIYGAALALAEKQQAMLLIDPPPRLVGATALINKWANALGVDHPNAALYAPRLKTKLGEIGPSGTIAGVAARMDARRGVWAAPAGMDAVTLGAEPIEAFSDQDQNLLNPENINAIRVFPNVGSVVWGARTASSDPEWRYVPVRRFFLFLEKSLTAGLQWAVFEPNAEPLWAQIRASVEAFLQDYFRQGAMQGATPRDSYFVRCDRTTMTQTDIDNGLLKVLIGFAPTRPAEFIMLPITLKMAAQ